VFANCSRIMSNCASPLEDDSARPAGSIRMVRCAARSLLLVNRMTFREFPPASETQPPPPLPETVLAQYRSGGAKSASESYEPTDDKGTAKQDGLAVYLAQHFDGKDPLVLKPGTATDAPPLEYSIFVNLAANIGNTALKNDDAIQQLTELTKNNPVEIVVQTVMSTDPHINQLDRFFLFDTVEGYGTTAAGPQEMVRYRIRNGTKELLYAGEPRGIATDLEDLLYSAPEAEKAHHVVLIQDSHGSGMGVYDSSQSLAGNAGSMSLDQFNSIVSEFLKQSGKSQLDLVDFDACLMGNVQALTKLHSLSHYTVASEQPEESVVEVSPDHDIRDYQWSGPQFYPSIADIVLDPKLDPRTVAESLINADKRECEGLIADTCGAETLAVYDNTAAPTLSYRLDQFGEALLATKDLGMNKIEFQAAIEAAEPAIVNYGFPLQDYVRDLPHFVSAINSGLKSGKIADTADRTLRHAADNLEDAIDNFMIVEFSHHHKVFLSSNDYLPLQGGLSTFLSASQRDAGKNMIDPKSDPTLVLEQMREDLNLCLQRKLTDQLVSHFINDLIVDAKKLAEVAEGVSTDSENGPHAKFLGSVNQLISFVKANAHDNSPALEAEFQRQLAQINQGVENLTHEDGFKKALNDNTRHISQRIQLELARVMEVMALPSQPHWNQFVSEAAVDWQ